jgi:hypothetical protein
MKKRKSEPAATKLEPSHPNYDAIMLKRSRLESHRRRRAENSGVAIPAVERKSGPAKPPQKKKAAVKRKKT